MLEFAGLDAGLCRTLLTQMSKFADILESWNPASTLAVPREAN
jgi:hypothetical protein